MDGCATDEMIEIISQMEYLEEISITNCAYVSGEFLKELRSSQRNNLRKMDFSGSYQIEFEQIIGCV